MTTPNLNINWTDDGVILTTTVPVPHEDGSFAWDDPQPAYIRVEIDKLTGWVKFSHVEYPTAVPTEIDMCRMDDSETFDWNTPSVAWAVQVFALCELDTILTDHADTE